MLLLSLNQTSYKLLVKFAKFLANLSLTHHFVTD
jgi:hypothetical protein